MDADVPSLELQVKFLKANRQSRSESSRMLVVPTSSALTTQPVNRMSRLPESVWLLSHKVVAFTQNYVQNAGWHRGGILQWIFIHEPWWTVESGDRERYINLFSRADWLKACGVLADAHHKFSTQLETRNSLSTEDHALLRFLSDSLQFSERIYRDKLPD
jgi:hypothetical protein